MSTSEQTDALDDSMQPRVRINIRDFGPIASACVDLRPLTVFVGPSNTGKTYLSILIYALHRALAGFRRLPVPRRSLLYPYDILSTTRSFTSAAPEDPGLSDEEVVSITTRTSIQNGPFMYSDLPPSIRNRLHTALHDPNLLAQDIQLELKRCFDTATVSELVRLSGHRDGLDINLNVTDQSGELWHFKVNMSDPKTTVSGGMKDIVLVPKELLPSGYYPILRLRGASGRTPTSLFLNSLMDMGAGGGTGEPHNA